MKKVFLVLSLIFCVGLGYANVASAKEPTYDELKNQVKALKEENQKLKDSMPIVKSGPIFTNGVKNTTSNFVTVGGKHFVEINSIIPTLTSYTSQQVSFDSNKKELYLGIKPSKGVIDLTDLERYDGSFYSLDRKNFSINKQKYSKNISAIEGWSPGTRREITYKLHGNYSSLQFFYGMTDNPSKNTGEIIILGDGNELLFNSGEVERQEDPKYAEVNVKGVKTITIKFELFAGIGNPTLTPK